MRRRSKKENQVVKCDSHQTDVPVTHLGLSTGQVMLAACGPPYCSAADILSCSRALGRPSHNHQSSSSFIIIITIIIIILIIVDIDNPSLRRPRLSSICKLTDHSDIG